MKKLTLLTTLTVSMMFSPVCWGEWVEVSKSVDGDSYYVDFDRIRQYEGYVYFWELSDYITNYDSLGTMSVKVYNQGDCDSFRYKRLSYTFYKGPMGEGTSTTETPDTNWNYPPPNSFAETILKSVCDFVKTR